MSFWLKLFSIIIKLILLIIIIYMYAFSFRTKYETMAWIFFEYISN